MGGDLDSLATSDTGVKVTIGGKSAVQAITVNAAPTPGITVTGPTKTAYQVGDAAVDWAGGTAVITAADGTQTTVDLSDSTAVTNAGLTITATIPGTYQATFSGTVSDGTHNATVNFTMTPRDAAVQLTGNAATIDVSGGAATDTSITASIATGGFGSLSATGTVTTTGAGDTSKITAAVNTTTGAVTISVAADADAGTYTVSIGCTKTDGGAAGTPADITVTVTT